MSQLMSQLNKQHLKWASIAEARLMDAFPQSSVFTQLTSVHYAHGVSSVRLELSVVPKDNLGAVGSSYEFNQNTPTQIGLIHLNIKSLVARLQGELNAKINKQAAPAVGSIPTEPVQCPAVDSGQGSAAATGSEPEDGSGGSGLVEEYKIDWQWPAGSLYRSPSKES